MAAVRRQRVAAAIAGGVILAGAVALIVLRDDGANGSQSGTRVEQSGLVVRIPEGWSVRPDDKQLGLAVFTGSSAVQDPDCDGGEETVSVDIVEVDEIVERTMPACFDEATGTTADWTTVAEIQCDERWQTVRFREADRSIRVLIRSGREGAAEKLAEAYAVLNSLVVRPHGPATIVAEVPRPWNGVLQLLSDGSLRAPGFNEFVGTEQPDWSTDPEAATRQLLGFGAASESGVSVVTTTDDDGATVTIERLIDGDDSVAGSRHRVELQRDASGRYLFGEGSWAYLCKRGPTQGTYAPRICV